MKHTEFALGRPVTTVVVFVAMAMVGLIASRLLPLEQLPDIEFPVIFIEVPYQGSTPEEIEQQITRPMEEALATLSGVERMFSSSSENQAQVILLFDWGLNMGAKGIEARAKIDGIRDQMPEDIQRVFVFSGSTSDQAVLTLRISSDRDLADGYDLLDRLLKRRLERLEGVSRVQLQGVDPREIRILLRADAIAAYGVDIGALREQLLRSNFSVSAGQITAGDQRFSVRPSGEFASVEQIRNLAINAAGLRLGDVADVEMRTPERNYGRHLDQNYAIGVEIYKSTGANLVDVTDRVIAQVEEIGKLPQMQGIQIFPLDNAGDSVRTSLADLLEAGIIGGLLAILVLYLFLRQVMTTLIVIAVIPLSLLITLGALYFAGLSLNILTMMGMMLAVGMLVDNAVVIAENVFRHRANNPDEPYKATMAGVKEVGIAVIAGTFTTIVVFAPTILGEKSELTIFLTHVSITIMVALISSLVIAQTLVPMLASRIKVPPQTKSGSFMDRLKNGYVRALRWQLQHLVWAGAGIVLLTVIGVAPLVKEWVHVDMDPPDETSRRLFLPYNVEGQHALPKVKEAVDKVETYLYANKEEFNIRSVYSYYDQFRAQSSILLTEGDEITLPTSEIIERIEENMPLIPIGNPNFEGNRQTGGEGFSILIGGDSTQTLNELRVEIIRALSTIEGLKGFTTDAARGGREVRVVVNRDRAELYGLTAAEISQNVAVAMRGENLRDFRTENGEVTMRLAFRDNDRQSVEQLADLPLYTREGERLNLGSVASFQVTRAPDTINRADRQTALLVSASLEEGYSLDDVQEAAGAMMDQINLPAGYTWKFGAGFERNDDTQNTMALNMVLGVFCIFFVMAALFESLITPLAIILGSITFSIFGVFLFFAATGTTFSLMAMIGILILIGVVVNNGIVLVDHINNLRLGGMSRADAIAEAGRDRLRPILMTVTTTIVGLLPLAIGTSKVGGGGPPYFPMARAIIGGLAFSTVVSLLVVPILYVYFDNVAAWGRRVMRTARRQTLPERGGTPVQSSS
ncbi:MAG: efflux RND transporter permease subunit [Pseudomonadota bacterium]